MHNEQVTLMRTSVEENLLCARQGATGTPKP